MIPFDPANQVDQVDSKIKAIELNKHRACPYRSHPRSSYLLFCKYNKPVVFIKARMVRLGEKNWTFTCTFSRFISLTL